MPDRFCSECGIRLPDDVGERCPQCGEKLSPPPATAQQVPPESLTTSSPTTPSAVSMPADGQRRCPHCGEALYRHERVCWACKRRVDPWEAPEPARAESVDMAGQPLPGAPTPVPPAAAAQMPTAPTVPQAGRAPLSVPPPDQPSDEAMGLAWWAFGLGLISVFTCGLLGLLGPIAIWLGVSANRRKAGPVAVAGIVFGVLGTLVLLVWVVGLLLAFATAMRTTPTHVFIPNLQWGAAWCISNWRV